jgi:hypothetical protein
VKLIERVSERDAPEYTRERGDGGLNLRTQLWLAPSEARDCQRAMNNDTPTMVFGEGTPKRCADDLRARWGTWTRAPLTADTRCCSSVFRR